MNRVLILWATALLVLFINASASAQTNAQTNTPSRQFWPGTDIFVRLRPNLRLYFSSARTKENGKNSEQDFGFSIDFLLKPMAQANRSAGSQDDESKSNYLLLRAGYHKLLSLHGSDENRVVLEAVGRIPLKTRIALVDRNRLDLRWQNEFSWRYRNRLSAEQDFKIHSHTITPYVRVEFYYDSSAKKWSRIAEAIGCTIPIRKHFAIEPYYEHQNDTSQSPNRQVNAVGLTFTLRFSR